MADMAAAVSEAEDFTRNQRYYALHREQKLAKVIERYNSKPEIIAKREERDKLKLEKATQKHADKEAKKVEKEKKREEKERLAVLTSRKKREQAAAPPLNPPVSGNLV
jgi:hypothetical protein